VLVSNISILDAVYPLLEYDDDEGDRPNISMVYCMENSAYTIDKDFGDFGLFVQSLEIK